MTDLTAGWSTARIGELLRLRYGKAHPSRDRLGATLFPVIGSAGEMARCDTPLVEHPVVVIGRKGNVGAVHLAENGCWPTDTTFYTAIPDYFHPAFLAHQLGTLGLKRLNSSTATPSLRREDLERQQIRVPPLDEQRRIVEILEDHISRLDAAEVELTEAGRRATSLRRSTVEWAVREGGSDPGTTTARLGEVARIGTGATPLRSMKEYWSPGAVPWVTSGELHAGRVYGSREFISLHALERTGVRLWPVGTLLVAMYGEGRTRGTVAELAVEAATNQACAGILLYENSTARRAWLRLYLDSQYLSMRRASLGGVQPNLSLGYFRDLEVPWPPASTLKRILKREDERALSLEHLSVELDKAQRRLGRLRLALLGAAFSGRLTSQPSDANRIEELTSR